MLQTALIVDDDHLEREYLTELLLRNGFVVRAAASVPNATALMKDMHFDCLFIDDRMPFCTGEQALQSILEVRPEEERTGIQSYLLGDAREESARRYQEHGFQFFLEKPVDVGRLLVTMGARVDMAMMQPIAPDPEVKPTPTEVKVEGLDHSVGIANCGNEENYVAALKIFYETMDRKADEIEEYYRAGDRENYTIKVHALKSSARIIGAMELSEFAADLEAAGKRGDDRMIERETGRLLRNYRALKKPLSPLFDSSKVLDSRPEADEETIRDALHSISEFAEQMDYDLVEMVLNTMEEYRLSAAEQDHFARIKAALLSLDWDAVRKEVE